MKIYKSVWCLAVAVALPILAWAAGPEKAPKNEPPAKEVELFAGMKSGEIEAVLIYKDATQGSINIKNKTGQPLAIKLPEAFAGVPILAQRGGGGGGGNAGGLLGGGGGGGGSGGAQGMGGGMMGGGGGMMGGGMGGGMFNVGPEKVQKVKIAAVCLDHGLRDPHPRIPYKPIPIESYAKDPAIPELIKLMLQGTIDQHSAQAAAWHIQNGLSWDELANKVGVKHIDGRKEPYFLPTHLERAFVATRAAQEQVEKANKAKPTEPSSSSQFTAQQ